MQKNLMKLVLLVAVLAISATAFARGPQGIQYTIHNLSDDFLAEPLFQPYPSSNYAEICVYCHTPHGGNLGEPLWNHAINSPTAYTHYTSTTLEASISASRPVSNTSLLCLGCHDSTIGVGQLTNPSNLAGNALPITNQPIPTDFFGIPNPSSIGTDLTNDHPISFNYNTVATSTKYTSATSPFFGEIVDLTTAKTNGVRFFGAGKDMLECSSCHDPHVRYDTRVDAGASPEYSPFLIIPNTGSGLCLACHQK